MKSTDRSAEPSYTESSMASTDLRADLENAVFVSEYLTAKGEPVLGIPQELYARALAALDEAEAQVAALGTSGKSPRLLRPTSSAVAGKTARPASEAPIVAKLPIRPKLDAPRQTR